MKYSSNPGTEERGEWLSSGPIIYQFKPGGNGVKQQRRSGAGGGGGGGGGAGR